MKRCVVLALPLGLWALLSIVPAAAQTRLLIPCGSGPPCQADVAGYIDAVGAARLPWVVAIPVPAGVCLRVLRVTSDGPVIRSAVAPNGVVFRDADVAILISPTIAGWYTVQLDTPPPGREQLFNFRFGFFAAADCASGATIGR